MEAALNGSREIGFTIISMTLSLTAVFIPVLFMGGHAGRLLHEFAVTIGVAVLVSGFVSLTLTPMLCSRFLKHSLRRKRHGALLQRAAEKVLDGMARGLRLDRCSGVLRHRPVTLLVALGTLSLVSHGYLLVITQPKTGFIPRRGSAVS